MSRNAFEDNYVPADTPEDLAKLEGRHYTLLPKLAPGESYHVVELSNGRSALVIK